MSNTIAWEMRSAETDALVSCIIQQTAAELFVMRITHGTREVFRYSCTSAADALDRAVAIQADLLNHHWAKARQAVSG